MISKLIFLNYIQTTTCSCVKDNSFAFKYWKYDWRVTALTTAVKCCRVGFMKFYGLTKYSLAELTDELKESTGHKHLVIKKILSEDDRPNDTILSQMREEAAKLGFKWTKEMEGKLKLPRTDRAGDCYAWLANYFNLIADMVPNQEGEYHIDRLHSIKSLYEEYRNAMCALNKIPYEIEAFRTIRTECFEHVKVRSFKAVSSKCHICARLSELRSKVSCIESMSSYYSSLMCSFYHPLRRISALEPVRNSLAFSTGTDLRSWRSGRSTTNGEGSANSSRNYT